MAVDTVTTTMMVVLQPNVQLTHRNKPEVMAVQQVKKGTCRQCTKLNHLEDSKLLSVKNVEVKQAEVISSEDHKKGYHVNLQING